MTTATAAFTSSIFERRSQPSLRYSNRFPFLFSLIFFMTSQASATSRNGAAIKFQLFHPATSSLRQPTYQTNGLKEENKTAEGGDGYFHKSAHFNIALERAMATASSAFVLLIFSVVYPVTFLYLSFRFVFIRLSRLQPSAYRLQAKPAPPSEGDISMEPLVVSFFFLRREKEKN